MARPVRLIISYIFDWIVIIVVAAAGGALNYITGFHRPFSLSDPTISFPNKPDIVSLPVLVVVALLAPAAIIGLTCLLNLLPSRTSKAMSWRRCLWEIHVGWVGLCTGLAVTLFLTSGLKDVVGKPRPNLLSRCQPDLTHIDQYIVSGFGSSLNSEAEPIVSSKICQQTDHRLLDDAFAAFPSGHSSFSTAGMVYLSLWLFARFSLGIPTMNQVTRSSAKGTSDAHWISPMQAQQSAPPSWQLVLAFSPIVAALFVCASRFADFHHAGFDIIAGMIIGGLIGWASFRYYHLPMRQGRGTLAWGPRPHGRAFSFGLREEEKQMGRRDEELAQASEYEMHGRNVEQSDRILTGSSTGPLVQNQAR